MAKKHNEFIHKVFSYLPLISFFVIILFLYAVYMTTYLGKLLANDYGYDKTQSQPEGYATLFLTMKTINTYTDSMVNKFQTEEVQLSNDEQKGAIYFIVTHVLLIMLFLAVFRTIFTAPGNVPTDWSNATEAELYNAAEAEKLILVDNWRRRRRNDDTQAKTPTRGSVTDEEARLHTGYGRDEEETPIGQGGQGEEIGRNVEDILEDPQLVEQLNQMAFTNAMKKENKRFCGHCQMFKPPRTHHCRQCNVCILKMDHHCPWVGNCVGFRNYKYFINMVFYGVLLLWFTFATYTELVSDTLFNPSVNTGLIFLIFFAYLLNGVIGLVITGFFGFHCFLIIRGKTTLELVEGKKSGDYNQGVWGNIKNTLGTNFFFWCIPTNPHYEGDGIQFRNKNL